jgi:hypothetical protein
MTTFARLRETFLNDREPTRALFCTFGFDATFFEAEILPALLPQTLSLDREAGSKQAYQNAADVALATKGITVFYDHLGGDGPELVYDTWPVQVAPRCFHPKLAVLDYGDRLRVVVSSANLTRPAWSTLLEIFVVEDLFPGQAHGWSLKLRTFLDRLVDEVPDNAPNVAAELVERLSGVRDEEGSSLLVSSWEAPIADSLLEGIHGARRIDVVTPFFEGEDGTGLFDRLERHCAANVEGRIWTSVEHVDGRDVVRGPARKLRALLDEGSWTMNAVRSRR